MDKGRMHSLALASGNFARRALQRKSRRLFLGTTDVGCTNRAGTVPRIRVAVDDGPGGPTRKPPSATGSGSGA